MFEHLINNFFGLGVVLADSYDENGEYKLTTNPAEAPDETIQVLVACHGLVRFDEDLVGDPLEKACLTWADWNVTKSMQGIFYCL